MMQIGIIREDKIPPDFRTPLTPSQVAQLNKNPNINIIVQPSQKRCFSDSEYQNEGVVMQDDLSNCDILIGVKEVPINRLISNKTYLFFSHTIKMQSYNRQLLREIIKRNIRLIDYEVITDDNGVRLIAFGKFAGMVGAHNAIWVWEQRSQNSHLKRMHEYRDYEDAQRDYKTFKLPDVKIVLTGTGRVARGAEKVLLDMGFLKVSPMEFLTKKNKGPVFTQLNSFFYSKRKDGLTLDSVQDFYSHPELYETDFECFLPVTDIMINGIFWDNNAPPFFTKEEMKSPSFNIKVISDITCDIAPITSIPSTLKATTIDDPVFGYNVMEERESEPYVDGVVDMTTIDNLPNEMPRDASESFGEMFIQYVIPELLKTDSTLLERATVADSGDLGSNFEYLRRYLEEGI